jgi:hypothetical protein
MISAGSVNVSSQLAGTNLKYTPPKALAAVTGPTTAAGRKLALAAGTYSGQANLVVQDQATLQPGETLTVDLYDGSVTDVFGAAAPFRVLRGYCFWVVAGGDASGVEVGDDGTVTNPCPLYLRGTSPRYLLLPGDAGVAEAEPAGLTVSATARNLKIANLGAVAATVGYALAGASPAGTPLGLLLSLTR